MSMVVIRFVIPVVFIIKLEFNLLVRECCFLHYCLLIYFPYSTVSPSYNSFTSDAELTNYENQTCCYNSKYNNKVIISMNPP